MSRLTAVIHRDFTHKHSTLTSVTVAQLYVSCAAVIGGGKNRTVDRGSGKRQEESA